MNNKDNSLTQWVNDYTGDLYSRAYHKVSDPELARDLVQDTFLAAAEKLDSFKGESSPKTWLFSILNHKIIDVYRKKMNQHQNYENHAIEKFFDKDGGWITDKQPQSWHEDENHLLDDENFQKILQHCLNALPEKWGKSVKLKYLSGKKGDEICQELGIAPTNLWQMVHRAKLHLRECVENNWFKSQ